MRHQRVGTDRPARICKALKVCQDALRPLMQDDRERVMRGLHAWYTDCDILPVDEGDDEAR